MSSSTTFIMSPESEVLTFKQRSGESFKEAWTRILKSYEKTEPRVTMSLLLSSFYFGIMLCYRYALDAVVGGDFLHYDGDQAYNAIKSLIASSSDKVESTLEQICERLDALESGIENMKKVLYEKEEFE